MRKRVQKKNCERNLFQAIWFALTNGYYYGFVSGSLFQGATKKICVPGLNCYSCPGALGACPIGALQSVLGAPQFKISCYVFGTMMAFGAFLGRAICGWLCPFGLVQDLTYRILPQRCRKKNLPGHRYLKWLKFVILALFVLLLPSFVLNAGGVGEPWFCEWICPSGTLFGGIPLVVANEQLRAEIGFRFGWKFLLLLGFLSVSLFFWRPFCKYVCPLGAVYGCMNPVSIFRYRVDHEKCTVCGACQNVCRADIKVFESANSPECIRCGDCKVSCPTGAITTTFDELKRRIMQPSVSSGDQEVTRRNAISEEGTKRTPGVRVLSRIAGLCSTAVGFVLLYEVSVTKLLGEMLNAANRTVFAGSYLGTVIALAGSLAVLFTGAAVFIQGQDQEQLRRKVRQLIAGDSMLVLGMLICEISAFLHGETVTGRLFKRTSGSRRMLILCLGLSVVSVLWLTLSTRRTDQEKEGENE